MKKIRSTLAFTLALLLAFPLYTLPAVAAPSDFSVTLEETAVAGSPGIYKTTVYVEGFADTTMVSLAIVYNPTLITPVNKSGYAELAGTYGDMLEANSPFSLPVVTQVDLAGSNKGLNLTVGAIMTSANLTTRTAVCSFYYKVSNPLEVTRSDLRFVKTNDEIYAVGANSYNAAAVVISSSSTQYAVYRVHPSNTTYQSADTIEDVTFTHQGSDRQTLGSITIDPINGVDVPFSGTVNSATPFVTAEDTDGDSMDTPALTWSIDGGAPTGVSINASTGVLTVDNTAQTGTVTIKAAAGAVSDTQTVTITRAAAVLTAIVISGDDSVTVPTGSETTKNYTAQGKDQFGVNMDATITWSGATVGDGTGLSIASDTGVLTVENTAAAAGTVSYKITATSGAVSADKTVTVARAASVATSIEISKGAGSITADELIVPTTSAGNLTQTYTAKVFDQYGTEMQDASVTWSTSQVLTGVSIANGTVTVVPNTVAGTYRFKAVSGSAECEVTVTVARAASVATSIEVFKSADAITTDTLTVPTTSAGSLTQGYTAKVFDQYDAEMQGASVTWSTSQALTGVSIANGTVTVVPNTVAGTYKFKAVSGSAEREVTVAVSRAAQVLTAIQIFDSGTAKTADSIAVPALAAAQDTTKAYTAKAYDQYGTEMINQPSFNWTLEGTVDGVTQTGGVVTVARGAAAGSIGLKVASGGVNATLNLTTIRETQEETYIDFTRAGLSSPLRGTADGDGVTDTLVLPTASTEAYTYSATAYDQYGTAMSPQPATYTWTTGGTIPPGTNVADNVITLPARDSSGNQTGTFTLKAQGDAVTKAITIVVTDILVNWEVLDGKVKSSITYGDTNNAVKESAFPATGTATAGEAQLAGTFTIKNEDTKQAAGARTVIVVFTVTTDGPYKNTAIEKEFSVTVDARNISNATITAIGNKDFTGFVIEPVPAVSDTGAAITADDYTVSYENNTAVGTATVKLTGRGNYVGEKTENFQIIPVAAVITQVGGVAASALTSPVIVAKSRATAASDYADFKLPTSVAFRIDGGSHTETVSDITWSVPLETLKGKAVGSSTEVRMTNAPAWATIDNAALTVTVQITDKYPVTVTVTQTGTTYGTPLAPPVSGQTEIDDGEESSPGWTYLYEGVNETSYNSATPPTNAGDYTVTATLVSNTHAGVGVSDTFTIAKRPLANEMITITVPGPFIYNKQAHRPAIMVSDKPGDTELIAAKDYSVTYEDNTNAGTAKVVLTAAGAGNYSGTAEQSFTIEKVDIGGMTPAITGTARVGHVLSVSLSGVDSAEYTVQWNVDGAPTGGTALSQPIDGTMSGADITVTIAARDINYTGSCTSAVITVEKVAISGTVVIAADTVSIAEGTVLTADYSGVLPAGITDGDLDFLWKADGQPIDSEVSKTFTVPADYSGKLLTVTITMKSTASYTGSLASAAVEVGKAMLTATTFTVENAGLAVGDELTLTITGPASDAYTIQWLRDNVAISGATGDTYTIAKADLGKSISVRATGTGSYTGELLSNSIAIPATVPEAPVVAASAGNAQITLSWAAPFDGGSPILGYTVTLAGEVPVALDNTARSYTFAGLTNGTAYTFEVCATNAVGNGAAGNAVAIPAAPYNPGTNSPPTTSDTTETVTKNEDGSTTTTVTDNKTGTVTETTEYPDGKMVERVTNPDGSYCETVTEVDGTVREKEVSAEGDVEIALTNPDGVKVIDVTLPAEVPAGGSFADIAEDSWMAGYVGTVSGLGLFRGVEEDTFAPEMPMDRGMLVTVLFRLSGEIELEGLDFDDVDGDAYYAAAVKWASGLGIVKGISDTEFAPAQPITRESLAVMLYRYAAILGAADGMVEELDFADVALVSTWADDAIRWAVSNGIISGKDGQRLDPQGEASRGEVAAMLARFVELLTKSK